MLPGSELSSSKAVAPIERERGGIVVRDVQPQGAAAKRLVVHYRAAEELYPTADTAVLRREVQKRDPAVASVCAALGVEVDKPGGLVLVINFYHSRVVVLIVPHRGGIIRLRGGSR